MGMTIYHKCSCCGRKFDLYLMEEVYTNDTMGEDPGCGCLDGVAHYCQECHMGICDCE